MSNDTAPCFSTGRVLRSVLIIVAATLASGFFSAVMINAGYMSSWIEEVCGLDAAAASFFPSMARLASIAAIPVFGALALKISPNRILLFSAAACTAGLFGMFFFPTIPGLIICYVLLFGLGSSGVGYTIMFGALLTIIDKKAAAVAAGAVSCCGSAVSIFLFPAIFGITASLPADSVFLILGTAGLITLPLIFFISKQKKVLPDEVLPDEISDAAGPEKKEEETEKLSLISVAKELLTCKLFYLLLPFFFLCGICENVAYSALPWYFQLEFGTSGTLALSFYGAVFVAGALTCGLVITRFKSKMLLLAAVFAVITLIFSPLVSPQTIPAVILLLIPATLAAAAIGPLLSMTVVDMSGAAKFTAFFSILYVIKKIGSTVEPTIAGICKVLSPDVFMMNPFLWIATGLAAVLAVVLGIRMMRQKKSEAENGGGKLQG
ncbi:MAG TPA: MFS transporter [Methanocorpusculum sp.]|nr:MFS transporter [Methanocorpusculum sp.]